MRPRLPRPLRRATYHSRRGRPRALPGCLDHVGLLSLTPSCIKEIEHVPSGHKEHEEENQHAKLLRPRGQHDQDEVNEVHEVVQRALHAVHSPSLRFQNVLLEKLSHSEVEGPEAYRAVTQGENKREEMSEDLSKIVACCIP